jgi:hypothetical protein
LAYLRTARRFVAVMLCDICRGMFNDGALTVGGNACALAGLEALAFFKDFPRAWHAVEWLYSYMVDSVMVDGVMVDNGWFYGGRQTRQLKNK